MTVTESVALKKKRPPTFQYLPPTRAKKLKQEWVLKQKVKSKWREEKRKLAGSERNDSQPRHASEPPVEDVVTAPAQPEAQASSSSTRPHAQPRRPKKAHPSTSAAKPSDKPTDSLREMAREAYSTSTLHTYRSRHSKSETTKPEQRKGKGQPNMKLRMNVMLEKIKRDLN